MNGIEFDYSVRSDLPSHPEEPASLGAKFVDTLDALTRIDPNIFRNWEIMDLPEKESIPIAEARRDIGSIIEKNVTRDDFSRPEPYYGYSAVAFTGNVAKPRRSMLRIKAGGKNMGDAWLQTGDWKVLPDPVIVTYRIFKAALLALNAIW